MNARLATTKGAVRRMFAAAALAAGFIIGGLALTGVPASAEPTTNPTPAVSLETKGGDHGEKPKVKVDVKVKCVEGKCEADVVVTVCSTSKRHPLGDVIVAVGTTKHEDYIGKQGDCVDFSFPGVPNGKYRVIVAQEKKGGYVYLWKDQIEVDCEKPEESPSPSPSVTTPAPTTEPTTEPTPEPSISTTPVGQELPVTGAKGDAGSSAVFLGAALSVAGLLAVGFPVFMARRRRVRLEA